jgi:DNA-binding transcriptional regulator GbsR (MarR family)
LETLSPFQREFILHWGEMSSRWGINRSMAQIHALLYLSGRPLNAEEITERLSVSRSNVSTSLRELQAWGIVRVVHEIGDRRDYFQAEADAWEMFMTILDQRKRREIDPTVEMLSQCISQHEAAHGEDAFAAQRMRELLDLLQMLDTWYTRMRRLAPTSQRVVLKMKDMLRSLS